MKATLLLLAAYPPDLSPPPLDGVRDAVSPLDLLLVSVASALAVIAGGVWHILGSRRRGRAVAACGVAGWVVTLSLAVAIEVERREATARPRLVVTVEATLRAGNGPSFPPRWPTTLPPGVECVEWHRRGGWVQVWVNDGTPGGLVGWLPEACVLGTEPATRIRP